MKLTRKKALEICIELWAWLAETGGEKDEWDGWGKYGRMDNDCPFCEYVSFKGRVTRKCRKCPIAQHYSASGYGCYEIGYEDWQYATTPTQRKKYAKIFLERLLEIK